MLTLILARAANGAIGLANGLPWHLPEDLAHFKRATMGATLLMGRRTWESIGRVLPGRTMVVLSRQAAAATSAGVTSPPPEGLRFETDLDAAIRAHGGEGRELFVIGGAELYRQALPRADRVLLTEIEGAPEADTFFDASFDAAHWETFRHEAHVASDGTRLRWLDLRRRQPG